MLNVGSYVDLEITDVAYGGECVAHHDGVPVFVRGAILGERVIAEVTKVQARGCRAIVRDVQEAAPTRIAHPWPLGSVGATGAADYGHMTLAGQHDMISRMLEGQLRQFGGESVLAQFTGMLEVESVESGRDGSLDGAPGSEGWHYRTRIDVLKLDTGVGMHVMRTNDLVPLERIPLAVRAMEKLDVFGAAWDGHVPFKKRMRLVAPSGGEPLAVIDGVAFCEPGRRIGSDIHEIVTYRGQLYDYTINVNSFWQIHEYAPSSLVAHVFDALGVELGDTLVDLYSGSGLFSLVGANIVGPGGRVLGFEGDERATSYAQQNLRSVPWASAQAATIDAENIRSLTDGADIVIADPPRAGLGVDAATILAQSDARRIALVSCDSASMARDVSALLHAGRRLESFAAVDIFPNTHFVETVCVVS